MRANAISLIALCLLTIPATGRAIQARVLTVEQAQRILAGAEQAIVACAHAERPDRAERVRVVVDWREQRRTGSAAIHVRTRVARQCMETAVRHAFGRNLRERLQGDSTRVSQTFRVPARRGPVPPPAFDSAAMARAIAPYRGQMKRCVLSEDPTFRGTVNLLLAASRTGELSLRGVSGVEGAEILGCLSRQVDRARLEGPNPPEMVQLMVPLRVGT